MQWAEILSVANSNQLGPPPGNSSINHGDIFLQFPPFVFEQHVTPSVHS
jgi:hypothetical protein